MNGIESSDSNLDQQPSDQETSNPDSSYDDKLEKIRCSVAPLSKEQLIELIASAAIAHQDVYDQCLEAISASPCSRRLMVRNIPFRTLDETFVALFRQFGEIDDAVIVREKDNRSKGYGFVTYKNLDSVNQCIKGTHHLDGKLLYVKLAADTYTDNSQRKLFIRNLPENTTEDDLREIFSKFGNLEECSVVKNKDGVSKGYGFLTFSTHREAFKAVQQQERVIGQRVVFIHFTSPTSDKRKDNNSKALIKGVTSVQPNQGYSRNNTNVNTPQYTQQGRTRGRPAGGMNTHNRWWPPQPPMTPGSGNSLVGNNNNGNGYREGIDTHQGGYNGMGIYGYSYPFNPKIYSGIPQNYPITYQNNMGPNHDYFSNVPPVTRY